MNSDDLIGSKLGNFRLERVLGRGRMGVVYLARDEALLRPTAVKILSWRLPEQHGLDPEAWFLAEARNAARINHPHVVQIYGVAKHSQQCYIAMEYITGSAADAWLDKERRFSPRRATEILIQAASALQAAHDAGVVHRDIKPGNLLITAEGLAKLSDFGMAVSVTTDPHVGNVRAGTPYYTAPEIWRGHSASVASDIYALGATYYHLLTGRPPFEAPDIEQLIAAHLDVPAPDPQALVPELPRLCAYIIQLCMDKSPAARLQSAQALSWEARGLLRELSRVTRPPPSVAPAAPSSVPPTLAAGAQGQILVQPQPVTPRSDSKAPLGLRSVPPPATSNGEPFGSVRTALRNALADPVVYCVLLNGERGSGRTTLARQLVHEYERWETVVWASSSEPSLSIQQCLLNALGVVGVSASNSGANAGIDLLLARLERTRSPVGPPAMLVVDDVAPTAPRISELVQLAQAAAATRAFRLLLIGSPELRERLLRFSLGMEAGLRQVGLPPLTTQQTLKYLAEWLHSPPSEAAQLGSWQVSNDGRVLLTPDAALIVAYRSRGNLSRINQIASALLEYARRHGRGLLSSWEAWSLTEEPSLGEAAALRRPADWPSEEVLRILNAQRTAAGLPSRHSPGARPLQRSTRPPA